jgi:hypothetical protein
MIAFTGAAFLVVGFIALIKIFGLVEKSIDVINIAKLAYADFQNQSLNDDAKEAALQRYAKRLFALFFLITLGGAAALALPMGLIWLLEQMGVLSLNAVIITALSWEFLLASTALAIVVFWITRER